MAFLSLWGVRGNVGLTETVKLAAGAVPLNKDGSVDSIKTLKDVGNIFAGQLVLIDRLSAVGTDTKFDVMFNARDAGGNVRWAYGPYKNGWDIHSYSPDGAWRANPLHVDYNTSEVSVPCNFHVGGAIVAIDGNIWGTRWKAGGAWLWDTIAEQLAARDNAINARAPTNTAALAVSGWFKDSSTGWIMQWGLVPFGSLGTITVNLPIPFPRQGFMAMGTGYEAVYWGNDGVSGSVKLLNNSQLNVTLDSNLPTVWFAIGC